MTLITPFEKSAGSGKLLEIAEEQFNHAIEELGRFLRELEAGKLHSPQDVRKVASDARKATLVLFEERNRLDQSRKKTAGVVHDFALDLEASRDEIGRRLARLRTAKDPGELSE